MLSYLAVPFKKGTQNRLFDRGSFLTSVSSRVTVVLRTTYGSIRTVVRSSQLFSVSPAQKTASFSLDNVRLLRNRYGFGDFVTASPHSVGRRILRILLPPSFVDAYSCCSLKALVEQALLVHAQCLRHFVPSALGVLESNLFDESSTISLGRRSRPSEIVLAGRARAYEAS